jgi:hypothetical protein
VIPRVVYVHPAADGKTSIKVANLPATPALGIRMEAEIETGCVAGGVVVERVRVREIGSMELLDVDECFGGCHLNCRSSDTSVYALRMIC